MRNGPGTGDGRGAGLYYPTGRGLGAERLVDISYCHYPAEMGIYEGSVEELVAYAKREVRVCVPTTTSTLCADLEKPWITGIPEKLAKLQAKVEGAHRSMGILETYTCTPHSSVLSRHLEAISHRWKAALLSTSIPCWRRTNRGGLFSRYSAVTGKYPLMGYLLPENRHGTHYFKVRIPPEHLTTNDAWCAWDSPSARSLGAKCRLSRASSPTGPTG